MKKGVLYLVCLFLLVQMVVASTSSVSLAVTNEVYANIEVVKYQPVPVAPGEYFDLWIAIETQGGSSSSSIINLANLQDVELELVEQYPFSLDQDDDGIHSLGILEMGEQVIVKYKILVDDDAASGDADLSFIFRSSDNPEGKESPALDISVQSLDETMNVIDISTDPEQLSPGKPASLAITIQNDALGTFKNIQAVLNIDGDAVPIVPYQSSKEQTLRSLEVGEQHTFRYSIIAEEDAEAGVYKIPFELTYKDYNNTIISKNDTFGILIGADADLNFNLEEFDTFQMGTTGDVVVSISNVGPTELKFMTVTLEEGDGYVILGPSGEYLGNLDSDDFETSRFQIYIPGSEDVPLSFTVSYKDVYNEAYDEAVDLVLPVYSTTEVKLYGLNGDTSSSYQWIFYLLAILFLYYCYKGWKLLKAVDKAVLFAVKRLIQLPFRVLFLFHPRKLALLPRKIRLFFKGL
jgi:hypothetical protein